MKLEYRVVLEVPRTHIERTLNSQYEDGWLYYGPVTGRQGANEVDLVFRRDPDTWRGWKT